MKDRPLRVLQIGAGSMGMRRLRDLAGREDVALALFDSRADRRQIAQGKHPRVETFAALDPALAWKPEALCISTPPHRHEEYVRLALELGLHHFSEANIWTTAPAEVEAISKQKRLVSAPSCSLHFLPIVKEIARVVRDELGSLHGYQMALNTYMPDWHPGEGAEYYARNRNTAAGREMVPFELLWLNEVFGPPASVCGSVTRGGVLPGVVEDTWSLQMELSQGGSGQLIVLMGCPGALRQGWCFGDSGQVFFDLFSGDVRRDFRGKTTDTRNLGAMKDVLEATYRAEITAFVDAVQGKSPWPGSYQQSAWATATLAAAEASSASGVRQVVDLSIQPIVHGT